MDQSGETILRLRSELKRCREELEELEAPNWKCKFGIHRYIWGVTFKRHPESIWSHQRKTCSRCGKTKERTW
jgi:hypothetical protein